MIKRFIFLILMINASIVLSGQDFYKEVFRPQYHLSPQWGWMGDPNGMIYFNNNYHLLWWGHALSEDLVYWTEYSHFAMKDDPGGFGYWSGSVVADTGNTAGFNSLEDTALIAIYTMHYDNTGIEKVGISSSLNHITFQYYTGNPVINIDQTNFRDPQVFWDSQINKWVMVITSSVKRAIDIYTSEDLKNWGYASSFDHKGAKDQVWEVPDLFRLPVNGDSTNMKWIMTCGMGPNRMQYWVGDFDGTAFTLDPMDNHFTGNHVPGVVFEDFEDNNYSNWEVQGTAFGNGPVSGTLPDQQQVNGFIGNSFVNSYKNGDGTTGKLISPEFEIDKPYINFLIGGGKNSECEIRLFVNQDLVASKSSLSDQEHLRWTGIDVSNWKGQNARIEIVDEATGGWGHILLDQIVFSDVLYDTRVENASWADWGTDFYAARSFRNYSEKQLDSKIWIGWMGNWTYARYVPTDPWKGHQSIPRELELQHGENGYQLIQYPFSGLSKLRLDSVCLTNTQVNDQYTIEGFNPEWNVYEMKFSIRITEKSQIFSVDMANNGIGNYMTLGFDAKTSRIFIDRSKMRNNFSNPAYTSTMYAPLKIPEDSILDFHVFVDQSSVEVFANNYKTVLSALAFSKPSATGITFHSEGNTTDLISLEAYKIKSIWGVLPSEIIDNVIDKNRSTNTPILYPNPVSGGDMITLQWENPINISEGQLSLIAMNGQEVRRISLRNIFTNCLTLDLKDTPVTKGLYLVLLNSENINFRQKLLIQ